ncbi:hypothetical protein JDV02_002554 [Purpureocillium takamizusanense]|uniref:SET domain-containing protein n=1 Tax=Purpureocillium takamizusanense TaxID=2060973 RepID=A0A9Q8QBU6_9HYPO|nr:uncharacterized protein JDV02_002554 [Purpureocillium takamizusanense]UNI16081.1 hypothetical protein JDV02_002554 [Purpureocillium takamizusanense]
MGELVRDAAAAAASSMDNSSSASASASTSTSTTSTSNSTSTSGRVIDALVAWATQHGAALHPSVEVYSDAATGLSLRVKLTASKPLAPWEPVVSLPTRLTLSYLDALADECPATRLHPELVAAAPPHIVGRLFLAKECLRGRDSFWWPYIEALPRPDADGHATAWALPPFWPPEEAELLDGTNLEVGIDKIRRDVARELDLVRELLGHYPCADKSLSASLAVSPALYHWAYCVFSSRSFRPSLVLSDAQRERLPSGVSMDDFSVLLPLFDIGNHDMTTDIRWDLVNDGDNDNARRCELKVGRSFAPGDQVFNNYSMKTNAELLLGYGFMVPATESLHNDYTHVRKRTPGATGATAATGDEYLISRRPFAHPSSLLARSKQTLRLAPSTKVLRAFQHVQPDMVWDIFCTLTRGKEVIPVTNGAKGEEAERLRRERFFAGQVEGCEARMFLEQTVAVIQHKVLQELERLNETDVEIVGGDAELLTRNQRLALDYRDRCRSVLEGTLEAISEDEILNAMLDADEEDGSHDDEASQ